MSSAKFCNYVINVSLLIEHANVLLLGVRQLQIKPAISSVVSRGVTRGTQFPWRRITIGAANHCRDAETPKKCHKNFLHNSKFPFERGQVRTWGRQTCFLPRAPSNLVTPLVVSVRLSLGRFGVPLSESPKRFLGKSVHLNLPSKKQISGFGLPPIVVKYVCRIACDQ